MIQPTDFWVDYLETMKVARAAPFPTAMTLMISRLVTVYSVENAVETKHLVDVLEMPRLSVKMTTNESLVWWRPE